MPFVLILLLFLGTSEQVPIWQVVLGVVVHMLGDVSVLHSLVLCRLGHPIPRLSMGGFERRLASPPSPGQAAPPLHGVTFANLFPAPRG